MKNDGAPPSADSAVSTQPHAPDGGANHSNGSDASAYDASASACTAAGGTCAPAGTCPATVGLEDACGDPAVATCCIGDDAFPDGGDNDGGDDDVDCNAANGVCQPAGGICVHEIHTSSCGDKSMWTCCAK